MMQKKEKYLIIGASAAGLAAAKKIRSLSPSAEIACFTDEPEFPYNKCLLVDWIAQEKTQAEVELHTQAWFDQQRIELHRGVRIVEINRTQKYIKSSNGLLYEYTALLLAVGASARKLVCPGSDTVRGVVPFYTAADAQIIKTLLEQDSVQNIVVIGGGISGIECADSLKNYGKNIIILERGPHILGRNVDQNAAQYLQKKIEGYGVTIHLNTEVHEIIGSQDGWVDFIICKDGKKIRADVVITALGSSANLELAYQAGLKVEHGAVVANDYLQTSDTSIFVSGDCALVHNLAANTPVRSMMWPDAVAQGMIAGTNMVELTRTYKGIMPITISHFFGGNFVSAGVDAFTISDYKYEVLQEAERCKMLVFDPYGAVKGFILFGSDISYTKLKKSFLTGAALELD